MAFGIQNPSIVVLAAGRSSRLGRPKQLLRKDGTSLLRRAVGAACGSGLGPVHVVLGSGVESMRRELEGFEATAIGNLHWEEGIASSIRLGLQTARSANPSTDGVLLMVCDQPAVDAQTLGRLSGLQAETGAPLAACSYAGTVGTPVLFHSDLFDELMGLTGDSGAKRVVERHRPRAAFLEFPEGDTDIDTETDCRAWLAGQKRREEA